MGSCSPGSIYSIINVLNRSVGPVDREGTVRGK
jgi:hypothetical protein